MNLEPRKDTMSKEEAESSATQHSKLDVLSRNSIAQDKIVVEKLSGTRVDFVELQRKKREPPPITRIDKTMASGGTRMNVGASNSTRTSEDSGSHTGVQTDAMSWASTWERMNRTREAFETRNTDRN